MEERSPKLRRTGSIFGVRRRPERLRAMWSDDVRFSALNEDSEQLGAEYDDDEWQVTFSDRVSGCCHALESEHKTRSPLANSSC